ncbi:MAG: glycosyltransferase family 2 protein [Desulfosalsimonadaceae bacterium]
MPDLDIIITNYNSTDYLLGCLESICRASGDLDANIFVIDNASTDNVDRISGIYKGVTLVKRDNNAGYAGAVNECLPRCRAPFTVVMNPDVSVGKGCFQCILRYMKHNPDVAVVGPRVMDCNNQVQGSARSFPTPMTALFGRSSFLTKILPGNRISCKNIVTGQAGNNHPVDVDWVSGACMVVKKEAIRQVGPMDGRYFLYWEDADWCKRMKDAGWRIAYSPEAHIVHYSGCSSRNNILRSLLEFHKSVYRFYCKYNRCRGTRAQKFLDPAVFLGLSMRFYMVLLLEGCNRLYKKAK